MLKPYRTMIAVAAGTTLAILAILWVVQHVYADHVNLHFLVNERIQQIQRGPGTLTPAPSPPTTTLPPG